MQSHIRRQSLILLVLVNAVLCGISALNLQANVFVLKATRWSPALVWSLDAPQMWLYYSPLLFPIWFWILLRSATGVAAPPSAGPAPNLWSRLLRLPAAGLERLRLLYAALPPACRPWLAVGCVLSLLAGFPFAHIDLSGAPAPDTTVMLRHYWQTMVISGIARPGAIFFCAAGIWLLIGRDASEAPGATPMAGRAMSRLFVALIIAVALRYVLAGPAIPRLEDEVAYHVQALIFQSGRLRGELSGDLAATGLPVKRLGEILQLPYIFFDAQIAGTRSLASHGETQAAGDALALFSSAHFHGWSAILAGLSFLKLQGHANALLALLNFGLFTLLLRRIPGTGETRLFALFLFACAPATVILTGTYMSHVATQSLLLGLFLAYFSPGTGARGFARVGSIALLAIVLVCLVFVRLQAAVPVLLALGLSDLLLIGANLRAGRAATAGVPFYSTRSAVERLGALIICCGCALGVYEWYSRALGHADWFYTRAYLERYFEAGCQAIGWGPGHGCFPTYGSLGHSFRKFLLNGFDRISELNHELSPGGLPLLPIALLLAVRRWRRLLDPRGPQLRFLLAFVGGVGVYSLYFHNGGESYRGRYVFETVFAFYTLFAWLSLSELERCFTGDGWRRNFARVLLLLAPGLLLINVALSIRGDYFSRFIQPYTNINAAAEAESGNAGAAPLRETIISSRDLVEQLGERDPQTGGFYYPLEFEAGQRTIIPLTSMKAFLNLGYATLAATATRLDERGLLRDRDDNVLIGAARPAEIRALEKILRMPRSRRLEYRLPETYRIRRGLVRWILTPPALRTLDAPP